jgi:O-antigen/teichoic acid export membrane protein
VNKLKEKWKHIPLAVKVSSAYAICGILQRCISFITLPLFTRLLSTEQYGQVTIYLSWHGILQIFLTLNLAYGSFSTAMVKFDNDRKGYISSIEGICVGLSLLFIFIYLPFSALWNRLFELPTNIVCLMVGDIICLTAIQFWSGKKRFEFKYISVIVVTLITSVISPVVQYLLVINALEKGYARIIGVATVNITVGGSLFLLNLYRGKKIFNKTYWKYALSFNIPLLTYYLSQIVFNQSDRIMISHMVGKDKAAIYGVAYSLATVLTFVLNAINNSYVPWYYEQIKQGKQRENKGVSTGVAFLMAILLLAVIWFAPEIIYILAGRQYSEAVYVVPPVAISLLLLFYSQLFINVEFYYEEKKKLIWASIGAAVTNLALNWIFIKWFGYIAAAYTTLVSYIIFAYCNYLTMKKILSEHEVEDNAYSYKSLILIFICLCFAAIIGATLYRHLLIRTFVSMSILIILLIKRDFFFRFYRIIKSK